MRAGLTMHVAAAQWPPGLCPPHHHEQLGKVWMFLQFGKSLLPVRRLGHQLDGIAGRAVFEDVLQLAPVLTADGGGQRAEVLAQVRDDGRVGFRSLGYDVGISSGAVSEEVVSEGLEAFFSAASFVPVIT